MHGLIATRTSTRLLKVAPMLLHLVKRWLCTGNEAHGALVDTHLPSCLVHSMPLSPWPSNFKTHVGGVTGSDVSRLSPRRAAGARCSLGTPATMTLLTGFDPTDDDPTLLMAPASRRAGRTAPPLYHEAPAPTPNPGA